MRMDYIPLLGKTPHTASHDAVLETQTPQVKRMDNIPLLGRIDSHHSVTG